MTLDAFLASVQHANIFSVGLNCSFGARQLKPFLEQLAVRAPYYISAYPNAGLPNSLGKYDQTPADMAHEVKEYIQEGLINIIGGSPFKHSFHLLLVSCRQFIISQGTISRVVHIRTHRAGLIGRSNGTGYKTRFIRILCSIFISQFTRQFYSCKISYV